MGRSTISGSTGDALPTTTYQSDTSVKVAPISIVATADEKEKVDDNPASDIRLPSLQGGHMKEAQNPDNIV